jgi:ribosome-binding protein aMBF1 (putative translation factor)
MSYYPLVTRWRVEFYRLRRENPVVEELLELRVRDVRLATEVVQDLKDLEEFGLDLPEKRLHKVKGTDLWELRSRWQHRIARSLFFEAGGRLLVVTTIFKKKTQAIPKTALKRGRRADAQVEEGTAVMELKRFVEKYVMTDPEWRRAYEEADATREAARALARARREAGLSQAALAKKVGTGQAVISRIENGTMSPTLDMVSRLARGLGVRPVIAFESAQRVHPSRKISKGARRPPATKRKRWSDIKEKRLSKAAARAGYQRARRASL